MTAQTPGMILLLARAIARATIEASEPEKFGRLSEAGIDALVENLAIKFFPEARAAHSVIAGKVAELTKQRLMILAAVYREAPKFVATICDQDLDRSGKLLGEVRALADAALAPHPKARNEHHE